MPYTSHATRLYYEVYGSGTPLILISGLGGDLGFWADSIPRLQDHFQVIVFDNRGIGRSDAPDIPYSMELLADDVASLMDELHLQSAHILGFSMGGLVAQTFALKYPHRLQKLIIAASYAKINRQAELFIDAVLSVYEAGATNKQMFNLILPWLFSVEFLSKPENSNVLEFDEEDPLQQPLYAFKRQYMAQREFDGTAELSCIQTETLVLAGENDALAPVEDSHYMAKGIPHSRLVVVPGSGHLTNFEQPELFHSTILDFLNP